jgi:hypothetical protein
MYCSSLYLKMTAVKQAQKTFPYVEGGLISHAAHGMMGHGYLCVFFRTASCDLVHCLVIFSTKTNIFGKRTKHRFLLQTSNKSGLFAYYDKYFDAARKK